MMGHLPKDTIEVRVDSAPPYQQRYVGRTGAVQGMNGQFVLVRFEEEGYDHCFLPSELKTL